MTLSREKLFESIKRYKFACLCLLCFLVSMVALKQGKISFIVYSLIILASTFFLDITQTISLSGFGMFFYHFYGNGGVALPLVLIVCMLIKSLILLFKKQIHINKSLLIPLCIIALMTLHFFTVGFVPALKKNILELVGCLVLLFEFYLLREKIDFVFLIRFFGILLIFSCLMALVLNGKWGTPRVLKVDKKGIGRFYGYMNQTNTLATWSVSLIALYVFLFLDKKISIIEASSVCVLLTAIGLLTKSKTFLVLLAVLIVLYLIKGFLDNRKTGFIKLGIVSVAMVFVFILFYDYLSVNISRFFIYGNKHDFLFSLTTGRSGIWIKNLTKMAKSIFGILFGLGGSQNINMHNAFLDAFVKYGVVGTCLVSVFIIYFLVNAKKKMRKNFHTFFPIVIVLLNMLVANFAASRSIVLVISLFALYYFVDKKGTTTKVLIYIPKFSFDTVCQNVLSITKNLSHTYKIDILVDDLQDENMKQLERSLVEYGADIYYQRNDKAIKKYFALVKFFIKNRGKYQVVHINATGQYSGIVAYASRVYGQAPRVICHSFSDFNPNKNILNKAVEEYFIKSYSTEFMASSMAIIDSLYGAEFAKKNKVEVANISTSGDYQRFDGGLRAKVRNNLDIKDDYTILYVQDIYSTNRKKLVNILLSTIYYSPGCKFIIVGDKTFNAGISDEIVDYPLRDNIIFKSFSSDICELMNASDVLIVPSGTQCCSYVTELARICALPVVASDKIIGNLDQNDIVLPSPINTNDWSQALVDISKQKNNRMKKNKYNFEVKDIEFTNQMISYYDGHL